MLSDIRRLAIIDAVAALFAVAIAALTGRSFGDTLLVAAAVVFFLGPGLELLRAINPALEVHSRLSGCRGGSCRPRRMSGSPRRSC